MAITGAKRVRRGGWGSWWRKIPILPRSKTKLQSSTMTQKLQIAAANEGVAAFDEADDPVAEGRSFPGLRSCPHRAKQGYGDIAIAGAVRPTIGGEHHAAQAVPLLWSHARVWQRRPPFDCAPEAVQRLHPAHQVRVHRNDGCHGGVTVVDRQKQNLRLVPPLTDGGVSTFRAQLQRGNTVDLPEPDAVGESGRRANNHGAGVDARRPNDGLLDRVERGSRREIEVPSAAPPPGGAVRPRCRL